MTSVRFVAIICITMAQPDFAHVIRPEDFPEIYREVVREIGALVLLRTPAVKELQLHMLATSDQELIAAQYAGHFCRANIENRVARDFAAVMGAKLLESILASYHQP